MKHIKKSFLVPAFLVLLAVIAGFCLWVFSPTPPSDNPPAVMVNGQVYYTFSERSTVTPADADIAGSITACVDLSQLPVENDHSNFPACVGQPYAFVDGTLYLYYGGQWNICVPHSQ